MSWHSLRASLPHNHALWSRITALSLTPNEGETTMNRRDMKLSSVFPLLVASGKQLALVILCSLLIGGVALAQEDREGPGKDQGQSIQPPQEPEAKQVEPLDHFRIGSPLVYQAFQPCRMVDTRNAVSTAGGPKLVAGATRNFNLVPSAGACPSTVPPGVKSIVMNVTITQTETAFGFLTIYPGGTAQPNASSINWDSANATLANEIIMPVGADGSINVFANQGTHMILDVVGYFLDELATGDRLAITGSFSAWSPIVGFNNSAADGSHGVGGFSGAAGEVFGVQGQVGASTTGSSAGG